VSSDPQQLIDETKERVLRELPRWIRETPALRQQLVAALRDAPDQSYMSYEEFLDWVDEDTLAEWVDGEIVMTSPASKQHQDIVDFLTAVMRIFVEQHELGVVLSAPFQMKNEQGREPDLLFLSQAHLERLQPTFLNGPADLVVEVISPESIQRDRGAKFVEYEAARIPEYWLIDPVRHGAEFYQLGAEGHYTTVFAGSQGIYHAQQIPGFWIDVAWLWQDPLPKTLHVIRELGLLQ